MYTGDKNSIYVGRHCEKFRLWEIFRLESSECGGGCGRYFDLLGQEVSGYPGLGGGPIHSVLQIQDCRKWGCLGVHESLWSVYQSGKGWHVGRIWGD